VRAGLYAPADGRRLLTALAISGAVVLSGFLSWRGPRSRCGQRLSTTTGLRTPACLLLAVNTQTKVRRFVTHLLRIIAPNGLRGVNVSA
jgi:hypothetical protein